MNWLERMRLHAKASEFALSPAAIRWLAQPIGLADPFRAEERELGVIFIHVPKSAGTSIARALFNQKSRHVALRRYWALDQTASRRFFKFAFVRNPWDRFQSAYHYLARRIGADQRFPDHRWATHYLGQVSDFQGFVRKLIMSRSYRAAIRRYIHFRDQIDWIEVPGVGVPVDFLGRYERLARDIEQVRERLHFDGGLPHERMGCGTDYRKLYSESAATFVGDLYARDVRCFDYHFGDEERRVSHEGRDR